MCNWVGGGWFLQVFDVVMIFYCAGVRWVVGAGLTCLGVVMPAGGSVVVPQGVSPTLEVPVVPPAATVADEDSDAGLVVVRVDEQTIEVFFEG